MIEVIIFSLSLATVFVILYSLLELVCCHEYKDYKTMIRTERRKRRFYRNALIPKEDTQNHQDEEEKENIF